MIYATTSGLGPLDGPPQLARRGPRLGHHQRDRRNPGIRRRDRQWSAGQHQSQSVSGLERRDRSCGRNRRDCLRHRHGIHWRRRPRLENHQRRRDLDRLHRQPARLPGECGGRRCRSSQVYVATDVGVFASSTSTANWTELGPNPLTGPAGVLPNVAVTALAVFNAGGQKLLRASTYGRGIWQFNLVLTPDFQLAISNSPQTVFFGQTTVFNGTATAMNGYASSVALSCVAGSTAPPTTCSLSPSTLTPGSSTPFTVTVGGANGDYTFNVQAVGSDTKHITHPIPVTLHVVSFGMTTPIPASVTVARGTTSSPVSFQITAAGSFNQSVTVACTSGIANAACTLTPGTTVNPTATVP